MSEYVDGFHMCVYEYICIYICIYFIYIGNRTLKPFAIYISGTRRGYLTNVQCEAIQNCHNVFPPYIKYIIIIMET
jgi:hypothetical protein